MTGPGLEQMVDASVVGRHLAYLRLAGMSWLAIVDAAGIGRAQLHSIYSDKTRSIAYSTARRIFAVTVPERPTGWMDAAECKSERAYRDAEDLGLEHPNELFIPRRDPGERGRPSISFTIVAKRVCARCPVTEQCLAYALDGDEVGIWGGTTNAERNAMGRKQR